MRLITIIIPILIITCLLLNCAGRRSTIGASDAYHAAKPVLFAPTPSNINIPVEIKIAAVEQIINDRFGGVLYQGDAFSVAGFNARVTVRRNGRIKMLARGSELHYDIPLRITMTLPFTEINAGILIKMRSNFSLGNNWRINTKTTVMKYTWLNDPIVNIGPVSVPVKPLADRLIESQLNSIGEIVDKADINIKSYIASVWETLQTPLEFTIPETEQKLWLRITPTDVYVMQPIGRGGTITTAVGIHGIAEAFFEGKPQTGKPNPLPNLKTPPETQDSSFAINLFADIPYALATTMSRNALVGKRFKSGLQSITVHDIEFVGMEENRIKIRTELTGALKGTVHIIGRMVYNSSTQTLSFENVDFDAITKSRYQQARNRLFRGTILSKMTRGMKLPLEKALEDVRELLQEAMSNYNFGEFALDMRVGEITVRGVEASDSGFRVVIAANGSATVKTK